MTLEKRACELQEAIGADPGDLPRITDAIRAAEDEARSAAMERVASRMGRLGLFVRGAGNPVIRNKMPDGYQLVDFHENGMVVRSTHPTFAAALAALTDEERAAWEREDA